MNELVVRSISGVLYVGLLVLALYLGPVFAYNIILLFGLFALIEFQKINKHKSPFPSLILLGLVYFHYKGLLPQKTLEVINWVALFTNCLLTIRLFYPIGIFEKSFSRFFLSYGYLTFSVFCIILITRSQETYRPGYLLITYLLIWTNNSFAYLVGKKWGKTLLFSKISPKKSWEGFMGGLLATIITGGIIATYDTVFDRWQLMIFGVAITVLATLGDLIESQFKRISGVKDSGSLIPGHGGFYDRMDSIIYTAPFVIILLQLFYHVS